MAHMKEKGLDLTTKVPAGLIERCSYCNGVVETDGSEPIEESSTQKKVARIGVDTVDGNKVLRWDIDCPNCGATVSFYDKSAQEKG